MCSNPHTSFGRCLDRFSNNLNLRSSHGLDKRQIRQKMEYCSNIWVEVAQTAISNIYRCLKPFRIPCGWRIIFPPATSPSQRGCGKSLSMKVALSLHSKKVHVKTTWHSSIVLTFKTWTPHANYDKPPILPRYSIGEKLLPLEQVPPTNLCWNRLPWECFPSLRLIVIYRSHPYKLPPNGRLYLEWPSCLVQRELTVKRCYFLNTILA